MPTKASASSSRLKVKLPTSNKSSTKDIADDLKAIREALNREPEKSTSKTISPAKLPQNAYRKLKNTANVHYTATFNGHQGRGSRTSSVQEKKRKVGEKKLKVDDKNRKVEVKKVKIEEQNTESLNHEMLVVVSPARQPYKSELEDSQFVSPTGRPMRQKKPNQRYTDLISETEGGQRRRRTSSKQTFSSNEEEEFEAFAPPPQQQKKRGRKSNSLIGAGFRVSLSKMKKSKVVPLIMPQQQQQVRTLNAFRKQAAKQISFVKSTKALKSKIVKDRSSDLQPQMLTGEFEQPPEFFEINDETEVKFAKVDAEVPNLHKMEVSFQIAATGDTENDDRLLPPVLPISALSIPRQVSPHQRPKLEPERTVAPVLIIPPPPPPPQITQQAPVEEDVDFSQFTMPDDDVPPVLTNQAATKPVKKRARTSDASNVGTLKIMDEKLLPSNVDICVPAILESLKQKLAEKSKMEKPPAPKRRYGGAKKMARMSQEESMQKETQEALLGIKSSAIAVAMESDPSSSNNHIKTKTSQVRRGRQSNASLARFVDDLGDFVQFEHSAATNAVKRRQQPHPGLHNRYRLDLDEVNKFCALPPEVAGDHCYGKSQPVLANMTATVDQSTGLVCPPGLSKNSGGSLNDDEGFAGAYIEQQPKRNKSGRRPSNFANLHKHMVVTPSPPPYAYHAQALSPAYVNDPSIGAYYGADEDCGETSSPMLNNQNGRTALMEDDGEGPGEMTRVDIS